MLWGVWLVSTLFIIIHIKSKNSHKNADKWSKFTKFFRSVYVDLIGLTGRVSTLTGLEHLLTRAGQVDILTGQKGLLILTGRGRVGTLTGLEDLLTLTGEEETITGRIVLLT